jgi:transaldolase
MKLYLDSADYAAIASFAVTGLIDGVTMNPSNLAKQGEPPVEVIQKVCALLPRGFISVQVTEEEPEKIYAQAHAIAKLSDTILVKVPCYMPYYPIIRRLVADGIRLNITLVFSLAQALWMSKLKVHTISPFIGRLYEAGSDGLGMLADICAMRNQYGFATEVLAASVRTVEHVEGAIRLGADAMTISPALFQSLLQHPLTDKGVAQFKADWGNFSYHSQFPRQ